MSAARKIATKSGNSSDLIFWKLQRPKYRPVRTASTILVKTLTETHPNPILGRLVGCGVYFGPVFLATQAAAQQRVESLVAEGWKIVRAA